MAVECGVSLQICAIRATLLDELGSVLDVEDNAYVSDKMISVVVTPDIEPGTTSTVVSGCDCTVVDYRGNDKLKRWLFELNRAAVEPALLSMMIGATLIEDGADAIGVAWPSAQACGDDVVRLVAIEFWTKHFVDDSQDPTWPWWHHVYPATSWQIGAVTYENGPATQPLNGFSKTNTSWGQGPYGDGPGYDIRRGGFWLTTDGPPTAQCGFVTAEPGS
jgi:hypothetical protein